MTDNLAGIYGRITLVRNLWWDIWCNICAGISGGISVLGYLVGYLGIEMINVGSTTESETERACAAFQTICQIKSHSVPHC